MLGPGKNAVLEKGAGAKAEPGAAACPYCGEGVRDLGAHLLEAHGAVSPSGGTPSAEDLPAPSGGLLTAEEERTLAHAIRKGGSKGTEAMRRLVERNLALVRSIARKYAVKDAHLEDLVQEGSIGLMKAAERFDPDRGFRFSTCAVWWIKQAIRRAMGDVRTVRVPVNVIGAALKARRMLAGGASIEAVAEALKTSPEEVAGILRRTAAKGVSMESGDGERTLEDFLPSPEEVRPETGDPDHKRLLSLLGETHRHVIVRRFGLDGRGRATLGSVGKEVGLSRERVRQLEREALRHLRESCVDGDLALRDGAAPLVPSRRPARRLEDYGIDPNEPVRETPAVRKEPQPHQEEALAATLAELRVRDRATVVMACGTGKTLVGMWAFMRMSGGKALVLAPSLFLLRQTLREWRAHGAAGRFLCVCSDATVGEQDEIRFTAGEMGIPVTTRPSEVRRWIEEDPEGRGVVLCTYHSARTLGAGLPRGFRFDLAIFDEAHRTTGTRDRNFSFGLLDAQIAASKRLFLTATPRGTMTDGSETSPFSMADERTYGRHVYELGLSEAIARGIVCDYKVVIAVVTRAEVASFFSGPARVRAKDSSLSLREAAYHVAFARAVQECGATRIITFHGGVSSADRFSRSRWLREDLLPDGFRVYHVNGRMPTGLRQAILSRFDSAQAAVVTNARCLNEGVDVPAVDMVAFMSPKKSRTDIVQTIGRALRKAPGKTVGYIMLPVLVDEAGNPLSTAAEYRDLSEVIYSLRDQDKALDLEVRRDSFDKGRGAKGRTSLAGKVLLAGPELLAETMKDAIAARVLAPTESSWDEMFGRLVAFKKSHGTCHVTPAHGDLQLSNWMVAQRAKRRNRALSERQLTLLDSVGFPWDPKKDFWTAMMAALSEWKARHGHCDVPFREGRLGRYLAHVRRERRRGRLRRERIRELDAMGFPWKDDEYKPKGQAWRERYEELRRFMKAHGRENLRKAPFALRQWATNQREARRDGKLPEERVRLLDAAGFPWEMRARRLLEKRKTSRRRMPVGTVVVRRQFDNGRDVEERWVKVSDTGPGEKRWMPYARWWWEKNRGPVPAGKGVIHVNGDRMDDSPGNLAVGGPGDRMRLAHLNDPEMSRRNRRSCGRGAAEFNRRNGKMRRLRAPLSKYFYPVLEKERVVLNCPFRRRAKLLAHFGADVSRIPASGHGPEVDRAIEEAGVLPVQGAELSGDRYAGFLRVDPELGVPDPGAPEARNHESRLRALKDTAVWRKAERAAALDLKDRK